MKFLETNTFFDILNLHAVDLTQNCFVEILLATQTI